MNKKQLYKKLDGLLDDIDLALRNISQVEESLNDIRSAIENDLPSEDNPLEEDEKEED